MVDQQQTPQVVNVDVSDWSIQDFAKEQIRLIQQAALADLTRFTLAVDMLEDFLIEKVDKNKSYEDALKQIEPTLGKIYGKDPRYNEQKEYTKARMKFRQLLKLIMKEVPREEVGSVGFG